MIKYTIARDLIESWRNAPLLPYYASSIAPLGQFEVRRVDYEKLSSNRLGESSASIRERVRAAREHQRVRLEGTDTVSNSDLRVAEVRKSCELNETGKIPVRGKTICMKFQVLGPFVCEELPSPLVLTGMKGLPRSLGLMRSAFAGLPA